MWVLGKEVDTTISAKFEWIIAIDILQIFQIPNGTHDD